MSFEITLLPEGEHTVIALKDLSTGTFVEIYSFGALLNKFSVLHKKIHLNVVDGFIDVADAKQNIAPYFKSAKLSPFVCRVKDAAYSFGEKVYNLTKYSAPPNAIHGLIYDASFAVSGHHATDLMPLFSSLTYTILRRMVFLFGIHVPLNICWKQETL